MNEHELIEYLEAEWDEPGGVFFRLRQGVLDSSKAAEVVSNLSALELSDDERIDRRLVALLWYLPLFLEWQTERVESKGGNMHDYRRLINTVTNILEEKLGVP